MDECHVTMVNEANFTMPDLVTDRVDPLKKNIIENTYLRVKP